MTSGELLYALPAKVSADAIEGLETVFHFDLDGETGGQYTITVANKKVTVNDGLTGEPQCVIRATGDTFVSLATGELNPMLAILTGKVKISNQAEMMRYAKIFGFM